MSQFSFHRPELAKQLCDALEGRGLLDARSGLFLAAPRRVGKSTFLREDLIPEAVSRAWVPVYVDLWSDRNRDPALLLVEAIKAGLAGFEGVITKAARASKLEKVSVLGALTLDFSQPGLPDNVTITDVLEVLHKLAKAPVVLIVDEAQHALTTDAGVNAMFALKAARDYLNTSSAIPALMLVMTGSNRDKLAHLVLKRDQPFFGAKVTAFPLLGRDFTDAFTVWANQSLADSNHLVAADVYEAFKLVGHRPEMLRHLIGQVALGGEAGRLSVILKQGAEVWHDQVWSDMASEFMSLSPLQKAVLEVMILKRGATFSPFAEESMAAYRDITGEQKLSTASVQTAIEALRDRGLVWNPARGAYALEDDGMAEWFLHTRRKMPEA